MGISFVECLKVNASLLSGPPAQACAAFCGLVCVVVGEGADDVEYTFIVVPYFVKRVLSDPLFFWTSLSLHSKKKGVFWNPQKNVIVNRVFLFYHFKCLSLDLYGFKILLVVFAQKTLGVLGDNWHLRCPWGE